MLQEPARACKRLKEVKSRGSGNRSGVRNHGILEIHGRRLLQALSRGEDGIHGRKIWWQKNETADVADFADADGGMHGTGAMD